MRSFRDWRRVMSLNEDESGDEEVVWKNLRMVFGDTRILAKPELLQKIKGQPLNQQALEELLKEYQGNKDAMAKDLVTALLKMIYQSESGSGLAVSGDEMQQQQASTPEPLGDTAGSMPEPS